MILFTLMACQSQTKKSQANLVEPVPAPRVIKTESEWKQILTPEQFEVLRNKGTERPHTGEYVNLFDKGKYVCAGCGALLFLSDAKFATDCGWPSFDRAVKGAVQYHNDFSFGMKRTEVTCTSCGGHLGHVFDDGPGETTGKRYCTNSVSVRFIPSETQN